MMTIISCLIHLLRYQAVWLIVIVNFPKKTKCIATERFLRNPSTGDIQGVGFKSLTILRPSMIDGKRDEFRFAESVVLRLSHILGPILPKQFRVNPASKIAEVLVDAVVASEPGFHFRYSDSLAE